MANELVSRAIFAWSHPSYSGVMLPALGAVSCARMKNELEAIQIELEGWQASDKERADALTAKDAEIERLTRELAESRGASEKFQTIAQKGIDNMAVVNREIATLTSQTANRNDRLKSSLDREERAFTRATTAEARVEALTKALEQIAEGTVSKPPNGLDEPFPSLTGYQANAIARAALQVRS